MQVGEVMTPDVRTCAIDRTFADAASVLHDNRISSVVIVDDAGGVAGIVTERDLVNVVADGLDPAATVLSGHMTTDLTTVDPRDDIADAAATMAEHGIRHLPVLSGGKLAGILSIRDLWRWALDELTAGHELPDLERAHHALSAAVQVHHKR